MGGVRWERPGSAGWSENMVLEHHAAPPPPGDVSAMSSATSVMVASNQGILPAKPPVSHVPLAYAILLRNLAHQTVGLLGGGFLRRAVASIASGASQTRRQLKVRATVSAARLIAVAQGCAPKLGPSPRSAPSPASSLSDAASASSATDGSPVSSIGDVSLVEGGASVSSEHLQRFRP